MSPSRAPIATSAVSATADVQTRVQTRRRLRSNLTAAAVWLALCSPASAQTSPIEAPQIVDTSVPTAAAANALPPADAASYCGRKLGSWFYCAPEQAEPRPVSADAAVRSVTPPEIAELEAYQKALSEAGQTASWNPTPTNVERYIRLQKVSLDKGGLFSDLWRRVVWNNPDLDYTLQRPTGAVAKTEFDAERQSDRDLFLRSVSPEIGVFYIYSGVCGPCRIASPIIKAFSDRYGVPVKVISTDGAANPVFGPTLPDRGQLKAWGIEHQVTPALLIFQSPTPKGRDGEAAPRTVATVEGRTLQLRPCRQPRGCLTYLGAGVMSVEDIAERFFVLLSKDPGTDY
jgi:conjugal transfer pilus assembly protein TraF